MISFLRLPDGRYVNVAAIVAITPSCIDGRFTYPDGCTIHTSARGTLSVKEWTAEQLVKQLADAHSVTVT